MPSPHKIHGSFLNKTVSPNVKKSPLKPLSSPKSDSAKKKILGFDSLHENVCIVVHLNMHPNSTWKNPLHISLLFYPVIEGTQWLNGRVLDSRRRGCGFEPHPGHCVVVLEQDTFILA